MDNRLDNMISIIIPVYNREQYLSQCIESVLIQDVIKELIIVDDGSTDDSINIIKEYSERYQEILYFQQENGGISKARNRGISEAQGMFLYFLDSDDCLIDGSLKKMLEAALSNDADMVIGNFFEVDDSGKLVREYEIPYYAKNTILTEDYFWRLNTEESTYIGVPVWARLYKISVWKNLRFPEGVIHEDEFIMHMLVQNLNRIYVIDEVVEKITLSKNSIMRQKYSIKNLSYFKAVSKRLHYLMEKGYYDYSLFFFGRATRQMLIAANELSDLESKKIIFESYCEYKDISKELSKHVNFLNKIRLLLFRTDLNLYGKVRSLLRP